MTVVAQIDEQKVMQMKANNNSEKMHVFMNIIHE